MYISAISSFLCIEYKVTRPFDLLHRLSYKVSLSCYKWLYASKRIAYIESNSDATTENNIQVHAYNVTTA